MKNTIFLPIESRRSNSLLCVPSVEVEEPVNAVSTGGSSNTYPGFPVEPKERQDVDSRINSASINAELNRRMSADLTGHEDGDRTPKRHVKHGEKVSVTFGNESDLEYDADCSPNCDFKKTVRGSKEFDGNRSGRKSWKQ